MIVDRYLFSRKFVILMIVVMRLNVMGIYVNNFIFILKSIVEVFLFSNVEKESNFLMIVMSIYLFNVSVSLNLLDGNFSILWVFKNIYFELVILLNK